MSKQNDVDTQRVYDHIHEITGKHEVVFKLTVLVKDLPDYLLRELAKGKLKPKP